MIKKMKAAILYKPHDLRIEEIDTPKIGPNEILIRTKKVGICGSDIHFYLEGRIGSLFMKKPLILGHECSGKIVSIGKNVIQHKVGDRVVIEPGFVCGVCRYCKGGRYNLCRKVEFYGTPPYDGAYAEYIKAPKQNVYPIPENISYKEGAMIEPLSVGIMAAKTANVIPQDIVTILGAGTIGQMVLQAVNVYGSLETYVTDIVDYRLNYAKNFGAKEVINAHEENVVEKIMELTDNEGVDIAIEASGSTSAILQTLNITKPGGRIILIGYPKEDIPLPLTKIINNEYNISGIYRYANVYPTAIKATLNKKAHLAPYITHTFQLNKIKEGFNTHINKIGSPMKIQISV
jgi:L-iditol 2-dehydrogenase